MQDLRVVVPGCGAESLTLQGTVLCLRDPTRPSGTMAGVGFLLSRVLSLSLLLFSVLSPVVEALFIQLLFRGNYPMSKSVVFVQGSEFRIFLHSHFELLNSSSFFFFF